MASASRQYQTGRVQQAYVGFRSSNGDDGNVHPGRERPIVGARVALERQRDKRGRRITVLGF
ncbi:hypothetical protein [Methylocaldum szegediense]|uniref:hypothetical protein n=1 Tax=Methylocaldum szegediense TaxID=73780 RepID=UPI00056AC926|nr:hypothetical protein [Methylocaldum szegediense]